MRYTLSLRSVLLTTLALLTLATTFTACNDDETYADKRKREDKQIKAFLVKGAQVKDPDSDVYLLDVPGNIKVISESQFYAQDSTTNVEENEYVRFDRTGVYLQIVDKGSGSPLADGETVNLITRYTEYNIAADSIQTTNRMTSTEMKPDIMVCTNTLGTFTASFLQGQMMTSYSTAAVPAGWLVPLTYIRPGRLDSPTASLAHVRIIVPSGQGQANASSNVYACFYDITYQRGR